MITYRYVCVLCLAAVLSLGFGQLNAGEYHKPISKLKIKASDLDGRWTGPTGLVINDVNDLSKISEESKEVAKTIAEKMKSINVEGCGDFTYRDPDSPFKQVTIRIYAFKGEQDCLNFWEQKYRSDDAAKLYKAPEGLDYMALDSLEMKKRAVQIGNIWITAHQLHEGQDHITLLDKFITKLLKVRGMK